MASTCKVTRNDIDNYLQKVCMQARKKQMQEKYEKAQKCMKELYSMYYTIMCSKKYKEEYNYTTCVWSILYSFPNILSKKNMTIIIDTCIRMRGVMKKDLNAQKLSIIEKISKDAFSELVQYTGANMLITKLSDKSINEAELYDMINDITPVVFATKLSHQTAIIAGVDDIKMNELAKMFDNCTLTMTLTNDDGSETDVTSPLRTIYIKTNINTQTESYNWGKKEKSSTYYNPSLNCRCSMETIMQHSKMMRDRV